MSALIEPRAVVPGHPHPLHPSPSRTNPSRTDPLRTDPLCPVIRSPRSGDVPVAGAPALRRPDSRSDAAQPGTGPSEDQVFRLLLENRIVFLGSVVEDSVANAICAKLLLLSADDPTTDIHLYINSPGGSVSAGMAIYDTMQYISNDVATLALGFAGSMGQFLLSAGTAGKRYALPHSRVMMHQPSGGIGGTASDIAIQAEQLLFTKRLIQERIAAHTGQPVEQIEADSDRDRWFTAEEARDYGLVDRVITRADQVAVGPRRPAPLGVVAGSRADTGNQPGAGNQAGAGEPGGGSSR